MDNQVAAAGTTEPTPTITSANLLYLLGMILVLTAGVFLQQAHFGWGLLATELLIGALALLWTHLNRLPWRSTLRLYPATLRSLGLAFVMGIGLWLLDSWLGAVAVALLGYDVPVPPGMYPQSIAAAALLFVGLGLGAPLGEELFFRGYMQRAYERMRPVVAIGIVALLFTLFHMSLVGFPPRLPIALALGYVAWRSGSLWPGVALHAGNNVMSALMLSLVGLQPAFLTSLGDGALAPGGLPAALLGLLLVGVTGWLFRRSVRPRPIPQAQPAPASRRRLLAAAPLLLALIIYGVVAGSEVVLGRFPELLAVEPLTLEASPWSEEATWRYRLQHPGEETVGEATCTVTPDAGETTLQCTLHHEPFEVKLGRSIWAGGDLTRRFALVYDTAGSGLRQIDDAWELGDQGYTVTAQPQGESLLLQVQGQNVGQSAERIAPMALVDKLWPWQLAGLPFVAGAVYEATLVLPQRYDPALERGVLTVTDTAVIIGGVEPLATPAGDFMAWRVTVGDESAWYDVEAPHTLLQYDGGPLLWHYVADGD